MSEEIPIINTNKYDRFFAAIVNVYKEDSLEIDEEKFRQHVRYFTLDPDFLRVKGAIIVNPEAGEVFYLTQRERDALTRIVLKERPPDMPVFCGAYGVRVDETISSALSAKSLGADGIFVMPPAGTMEVSTAIDTAKNPEIWTDHVHAVAAATKLPIILHPAAPYTMEWAGTLATESVKMLVEGVPSIVGYKLLGGTFDANYRLAKFLRSIPRHVANLTAALNGYHAFLVEGLTDGYVQGEFNAIKEALVEHQLAWEKGDIARAMKIWNEQVAPVNDFLNAGNAFRLHIRYKISTWIRGLIPHPFMRPPMPPVRPEEAETLFKIIDKTGLGHISRSEFERTFATQNAVRRTYLARPDPYGVH